MRSQPSTLDSIRGAKPTASNPQINMPSSIIRYQISPSLLSIVAAIMIRSIDKARYILPPSQRPPPSCVIRDSAVGCELPYGITTQVRPSDCDYLDADTLQVSSTLISASGSTDINTNPNSSTNVFSRHLSEDYGNQCRDVVWWTAGLASGPRPFVQHSYHRHRTILRRLASKANAQ